MKGVGIGFFCAIFASNAFSHGVLEYPPSREQFCGVESKPDEIYRDKMTHEECRPMMTKADGSMDLSIYNFMAVLSHSVGRSNKPIASLPKHVCGFDTEKWNYGETPWDKAINWPTSVIVTTPNTQKFVWNITWGNHFGDTREFVYWITKADFVFDSTRELTWNDFESEPFCQLIYDPANPTANPNIIPDMAKNKFTTTCKVPARSQRAVIYGEWGRNSNTYERFHACADVTFDGTPSPTPTPEVIKANLGTLPSNITGALELKLDGSTSLGSGLTYDWFVVANDTTPYQFINRDSATPTLKIEDVTTEQTVTVNLKVTKDLQSSTTSRQFIHSPAIKSLWKNIGSANLIGETMAVGDTLKIRLIDRNGIDQYIPQNGLLITQTMLQNQEWLRALNNLIQNNTFGVQIGVLDSSTQTIQIIGSDIDNKIYVSNNSPINSAFLSLKKADPIVSNCKIARKAGTSSYWLGYDIGFNIAPIVLDFSATGIDLNRVIITSGVFSNIQKINNTIVISSKPNWVNLNSPGYIGLYGLNYGRYDALNAPIVPTCQQIPVT